VLPSSASASASASSWQGGGVHSLPSELLWQIFSELDTPTLLLVVPRVCRRWRAVCGDTPRVRIDLTFFTQSIALKRDPADTTGAGVAAALMGRFRNVVSVYISGQGDGVLVTVAERCPKLTAVVVIDTTPRKFSDGPSDVGISALAHHCPLLASAILVSCRDVRVALLRLTPRACPHAARCWPVLCFWCTCTRTHARTYTLAHLRTHARTY
jgi:hypothetical protein